MKQNIFETRQRAERLIADTMELWQQSDKSEYIEGLQTDPVFRMLLNILAYQANEFDSEIEQLKVDILDEFEQMLTAGEGGKAIPASVAIETSISGNIPYVELNSDQTFSIGKTEKETFSFVPVLKTRVVNVKVGSVSRLDNRRWLVKLNLEGGVTNLTGMVFAINSTNYHGLHVSMVNNGEELPLISASDYANMPMADAFSIDTMLYNRQQAVATSCRSNMLPCSVYTGMDLLATQDVSMYVVDEMDDIEPSSTLDLLFEFDAIGDDFAFSASRLHLNVVLLANATIGTTVVSESDPVSRIAGSGENNRQSVQFLHLLCPSQDSVYGSLSLQVRRINADRFNNGRMSRLLNNLIMRYNSDYYAFMETGEKTSGKTIHNLRKELRNLLNQSENKVGRSFEGVYVILNHVNSQLFVDANGNKKNPSLDVRYLTTNGAEANVLCDSALSIVAPDMLDSAKTKAIMPVQQGYDEVFDTEALRSESRYMLSTEDRLVTPSDIKLFCQNEMLVHFGLVRTMINGIRIHRQQKDIGTFHTYEIVVEIRIVDNVFTQQAFANKTLSVENYLARMIHVRTNGMYPVKVNLILKN